MSKPKILVARAIFPETLERLAQHFEIESNQSDESWTKEQLAAKLQGKQGAFTTGSERIDAALLDACPDLKICANMAVGYNNCLLYTSPSPRDLSTSRMPSSA